MTDSIPPAEPDLVLAVVEADRRYRVATEDLDLTDAAASAARTRWRAAQEARHEAYDALQKGLDRQVAEARAQAGEPEIGSDGHPRELQS